MHWYTEGFGCRLQVQLLGIEAVWGNRGLLLNVNVCMCLAWQVEPLAHHLPAQGTGLRPAVHEKKRTLLQLIDRRCYHTDLK